MHLSAAQVMTIAQVLLQAFCFYLTYLVLKKYAWKPVLGLIDERNAKIEEGFQSAEAAEKTAGELKDKYEEHMRGVEDEAREKINEAIGEGRRLAEKLVQRAQADAEKTQQQARETVQIELDKARLELKEDVVRMTLAAAEKLVGESMDDDRHRRMVESFVQELGESK